MHVEQYFIGPLRTQLNPLTPAAPGAYFQALNKALAPFGIDELCRAAARIARTRSRWPPVYVAVAAATGS